MNTGVVAQPILSICIPTFNRAEYLKKSLDSLVCQEPIESEEIEIVISDNCSTDETNMIGMQYSKEFSNIKYFRNDTNYGIINGVKAISRGTGLLRKISNDTVVYSPDSLRYMINAVKSHMQEQPVMFFLSRYITRGQVDKIGVDSLDDFLRCVGKDITWLRGMCVWEKDCKYLPVMEANLASHIPQVPLILKMMNERKKAVVCCKPIMDVQEVEKKDVSYNIFDVFYNKYLGFIKMEEDKNCIEHQTYEYLKRDVLFTFFVYWIATLKKRPDSFMTAGENLKVLVEEAYREEEYFEHYLEVLESRMKTV